MRGLEPPTSPPHTRPPRRPCEPFGSRPPTAQVSASLAPHRVHLVLDNVRSAYNVGSIFRTADTARCAEVVTCGFTPHPPNPKLAKTAFGAISSVPSRHVESTLQAVRSLQAQGIAGGPRVSARLAIASPRHATPRQPRPAPTHPSPRHATPQPHPAPVYAMETTERSANFASVAFPPGGIALVLGNEETGVEAAVMEAADGVVEIPTFGAKNSLNVARRTPTPPEPEPGPTRDARRRPRDHARARTRSRQRSQRSPATHARLRLPPSSAAAVVIFEVLRQWGHLDEPHAV